MQLPDSAAYSWSGLFFLSLSLPSRLGPIKAGPTCLSLTDAVHPEGSPGSCWGWTPAPEDWPAAPTAQATGWGGTTRSGLRLFLHRLFSWVGLCWVLAAAQALLWLRCTAFSSQRLLLSWAAVASPVMGCSSGRAWAQQLWTPCCRAQVQWF